MQGWVYDGGRCDGFDQTGEEGVEESGDGGVDALVPFAKWWEGEESVREEGSSTMLLALLMRWLCQVVLMHGRENWG